MTDDQPHEQLPTGWVRASDPISGRPYYACPATGESSWNIPLTTAPPHHVPPIECTRSLQPPHQQPQHQPQHLNYHQNLQQPPQTTYFYPSNNNDNIQTYQSSGQFDGNVSNGSHYVNTAASELHYQLPYQQHQKGIHSDCNGPYFLQEQQQQHPGHIPNQHFIQYQQHQPRFSQVEQQPFQDEQLSLSRDKAPTSFLQIPTTTLVPSSHLTLTSPQSSDCLPQQGGSGYAEVSTHPNHTSVPYYPQQNNRRNMLLPESNATPKPSMSGNNSTELLLVLQARGLMDQVRHVEMIVNAKQQQQQDNMLLSNNLDRIKNTELSTFTAGQIADLCAMHIQNCVQQKEGDDGNDEIGNKTSNDNHPYYMPIDPYQLEVNSKRDFMEPGRIETRLHSLYEKLKKISSTPE
jgi:WW domain